ncbi:hypothetical protein H9Y04_45110, partial [Streptomyces sp. TRM66268-LWL]|nr:hypothetical protein [Streptomyces polyasparticus]
GGTSVDKSTDSQGYSSVKVKAGSKAGSVQVRATANGHSADFALRVDVSVTELVKGSGDGQEALEGEQFADPLVTRARNGAGWIAGAKVSYEIVDDGGTGSVFTGGGTSVVKSTDSQGYSHVNVKAGSKAGAVTVKATVNGHSQEFSLTVKAAAATPVEVLTPTEDAPVTTEEVTFTGKGQPGAKINIKSGSGKSICTDIAVDGSGNWTCDSELVLPAGTYTFTATQTVNGSATSDVFTFTRAAFSNATPVEVLTPTEDA